jgi:signal transduction histidine kinase
VRRWRLLLAEQMRLLRSALVLCGTAFGVAAEWTAYGDLSAADAVADFAVGSVLVVCGVAAWDRRPASRVGVLMWVAGVTWFLGTAFEPALYLHRGPLVQILLSYPTGRLPSPLARAVVAVAYVDAAIEPLARNDWATLALSVAVAAAAMHRFRTATGAMRKAAGLALAAAVAYAGALALGAVDRLAGWDPHTDAALWTYEIVIASAAIVLVIDLIRAPWAGAVVTGLVVDLGAPQQSATLRTRLARALGDPSLVVGYRLATGALVDEAGRPVELPAAGSGRAVTPIEDRGEQIAVLVHDEVLLADQKLLEAVAAAARLAVANVTLQAETRARADEIDASRRRIVEAADSQRRRLGRELRLGAERRLDRVGTLLAGARTNFTEVDSAPMHALEKELGEARREVREFAQGVHPAALSERGLMPALAMLAESTPVPVEITGEVGRLPEPIEAALFFVCSEALTNVAKHALASRASIDVTEERGHVVATIVDDGVGGANPGHGSGLRGLADRVEALGGRLLVESPRAGGTRLVAEIRIPASESA